MSHLILETVIYGKPMLATSVSGRDDSTEASVNKEAGFILSHVQKDRVLAAVCPCLSCLVLCRSYFVLLRNFSSIEPIF